MNPTRALAALIVAQCVAYEWWTLRVQRLTAAQAPDVEVNDTWSQITREVAHVDTLVGRAVTEAGLRYATDWFLSHLQEGSSSASISPLHRAEG